ESLPVVRDSWQRGDVGSCHVRRLARAHGNKRVREQLIACQKLMLEWATDPNIDYEEFDALVTDWVRLGTRTRPVTATRSITRIGGPASNRTSMVRSPSRGAAHRCKVR
ncbi:MAG: hypothetical protein P8N02_17445, partial [Actinomycetota bacterium]|nr:hypothetical protein [Actinomycetota bacterium]